MSSAHGDARSEQRDRELQTLGTRGQLGLAGNTKQVRDWWQEPPLIAEIPTDEV